MIIVCTKCSARLQLDGPSTRTGSVEIRCPKCNAVVTANSVVSPASEKSALAVGGSPATEHPRFQKSQPAPAFETEQTVATASTNIIAPPAEELARHLASILGGGSLATKSVGLDHRQILVCTEPNLREGIARRLAEHRYKVFVAQDTRQAVDRMRESQLDVVLLDPEFDAPEQGALYVTREVNVMRPAERRRLFFALISPSLRSADSHAAFLNNANLTVNPRDLDELPGILDQTLREFNELYKSFNRVMSLSPL